MKLVFAIIFFVSVKGLAMERVSFTSFDNVSLSAKLYRSEVGNTKVPAILIIEGSGKSSFSDEPEGSPFGQMAEGFAEKGFIVLKYNKRGSGENAGNGSFWKATFTSDNQDAQSALSFLKSVAGVDDSRIYLVGHSFGGPQSILLSTKQKVAGVVMLTSTIRPTQDLLLEQNQILMGLQGNSQNQIDEYVSKLSKNLEEIKAGIYKCEFPACSLVDGVEVYEQSIQVPWLKEVLRMNFTELAQNVKSPLLFLFGSSDCIIPESEYTIAQEAFKNSSSSIDVRMISKLDHFMVENDSKKESLMYAVRAQKELKFKPLHAELVPQITKWIGRLESNGSAQ
jgi:uncharacterized protein